MIFGFLKGIGVIVSILIGRDDAFLATGDFGIKTFYLLCGDERVLKLGHRRQQSSAVDTEGPVFLATQAKLNGEEIQLEMLN